ncbi:hypothetical protein JW930_00110 [Candidatus Woesearchaeota archaeon]|nr:hypothetical protein [Candidatus Woesearchaeota archaeon]
MKNGVQDGRNLPEKKFRAGAVTATVWKNTKEKSGSIYEFRTVSFERRYRDNKGEWQSTNSLRSNDLPKAVLVLNKAYEYLALTEQENALEDI